MKYTPLNSEDNIIITGGRFDTVVITGWLTPWKTAKLIVDHGKNFAAIGNLYSKTPGVNLLIRNLLHNPQIRHLILIDSTPQDKIAGSMDALFAFFTLGLYEDSYTVLTTQNICKIDREIPLEVLEQLRDRITVSVVTDLKYFPHSLPEEEPQDTKGEPMIFPEPKDESFHSYESAKPGQAFRAKNLTDGWLKVLDYVNRFGKLTPNRFGGSTKECLGVNVTIKEDDIDYPDFYSMTEEQCSKYVDSFIGNGGKSSDNSSYTYSQRMRSHFYLDQINKAIKNLSESPNSRGVVINLWDSNNDLTCPEPPCLNHIWVRNDHGKLYMVATFRSHDIFSAWYANVKALRALQKYIALFCSPSIDVGELTIVSDSAHIYERNYTEAELVTEINYNPKENYDDSVGNFVISVTDRIAVKWLSTTGTVLKEFKGRKALQIGREIAHTVPHIDATHLLYLGVELNKAEKCFIQKIKYKQDDNFT